MRLFCFTFFIVVMPLLSVSGEIDTELNVENVDVFLQAIACRENASFDPGIVGDKNLTHKAHGVLQIRKPYLDDINRIVGPKKMRELFGKSFLKMEDVKNVDTAEWCAKVYLCYFGKEYKRQTGKKPNEEVYARIHNGGPEGWKKWATFAYWKEVKRELVKIQVAIMEERKRIEVEG